MPDISVSRRQKKIEEDIVRGRIFNESDADLSVIGGQTVSVVGFGRQGSAQAANIRDSGLSVIAGSRPGKSFDAAQAAGFETLPISDAVKAAEIHMVLLPDEEQGPVFESEIAPGLKERDTLVFGSGFAITYGTVKPPPDVDVVLVAPKGPGTLVRSEFTAGRGVHNLVAVEQDYTGVALRTALAISAAIGGTRAAAIETTFRDEIETDLFGEQAVLCGGAWELAKAGFEVLVEAGYPEELAYFECLHELKQCVDLLWRGGMRHMLRSISPTAAYGAVTRGPRVVTAETREKMREILDEIRSGDFTREWLAETSSGKRVYERLSAAEKGHRIEEIGGKLRGMVHFPNDAG